MNIVEETIRERRAEEGAKGRVSLSNSNQDTVIQGLMGVGEVLESARLKFATEEGELDVDEDEYGNYTIGGQELSFEAWGELNKSSEPEIVRANIVIPPQRRKR